jgi:hypothetical protein
MTKTDIEQVVAITIEQQKKQQNSIQSWIKMIVIFIFVPIITVYSTFKVMEWRLEKVEEKVEEKVDATWYELYIVGQKELLERIENDAKIRDEELEGKIDEMKEYLDKLVKEKKLYFRNST